MLKKLPVVVCIFLTIPWVNITAQKGKQQRVLTGDEVKEVKKDASSLFNFGDYRTALPEYVELVKADPKNAEYNYRLGYCYLMTNVDKAASLKYLKTALQSKDSKKEWNYYLGMSFMYNEEWDDAVQAFNDYKTATNSKLIKGFIPADRMIEMAQNGVSLAADPVKCTFTNLGKNVNTSGDEYNPYVSGDGRILLYTTHRKGNTGGLIEELNSFTADICWTQWKDTLWLKAKNAGVNINSEADEESVGITPLGDKVFIFFENNSETFEDIGVAGLKGKMWQKPEMLPPQVNSIEYEGGACIANDGNTIYFSSKRKGGLGGIDLWMTKKEYGVWGAAVNLGNTINTPYDENAPYLTLDGKRLYFCSKGWNSMGDFDIFYCAWNENEGKWGPPVNIGYPINNADENSHISFSGDERLAYIAAVRQGGMGDRDIYRLEFTDESHHPFKHILTGNVTPTAGKIEITKMELKNKKTSQVFNYTSWSTSNQFIYPVDPGEYTLTIEGRNFKPYSEDITIGDEKPPVEVVRNIKVEASK